MPLLSIIPVVDPDPTTVRDWSLGMIKELPAAIVKLSIVGLMSSVTEEEVGITTLYVACVVLFGTTLRLQFAGLL